LQNYFGVIFNSPCINYPDLCCAPFKTLKWQVPAATNILRPWRPAPVYEEYPDKFHATEVAGEYNISQASSESDH